MTEFESTRVFFTAGLIELMRQDPRVVMVSADSIAVFRAQELQAEFPDRVIEVGIAEQNAVMTAAGLASAGMLPYVCTYAGFAVMRACEQMRTFVAYPGLNVKFFGANAGMSAGEREGVTHQFFEDLGILRSIPGIRVIAPADAKQTKKAVQAAYLTPGPVYVRIGSGRDPVIYSEEAPDALNAHILLSQGDNVLLLACGSVLANTLTAAKALLEQGVGVTLVNVSTIKPLDSETLLPLIRRCSRIVTVEDHNIIGGLGSAVCELTSDHYPCRVTRLGLKDCYPESGFGNELLLKYGLGPDAILRAAAEI